MRKTIWISYDLGVRGDYEGLYTWLADHGAKDCGDNLGILVFEFTGNVIEAIEKDIKKTVDVTKKTRIYVIWRDKSTKKMKGRFIFGRRRSPPWTGYATNETVVEDDES